MSIQLGCYDADRILMAVTDHLDFVWFLTDESQMRFCSCRLKKMFEDGQKPEFTEEGYSIIGCAHYCIHKTDCGCYTDIEGEEDRHSLEWLPDANQVIGQPPAPDALPGAKGVIRLNLLPADVRKEFEVLSNSITDSPEALQHAKDRLEKLFYQQLPELQNLVAKVEEARQ